MNTTKCSQGGTGMLERPLVNLAFNSVFEITLTYILVRIGPEASWRLILSCLLVNEYVMS